MKEFLAPFWEWLFDKFGVFGLVLAGMAPIVLIALAVIVIAILCALIRLLLPKSAKKASKASGHSLTPEQLYEKAESIKGFGDEMVTALRYYEQAAEGGHIPAQFMTGVMYYNGSGSVRPQKDRGLRWLTEAAENGHITAMYWVGRHYFQAKQEEEAEQWLTRAAEYENANAQYMLYQLYTHKKERREKKISGRWQDDPKCLEYYQTAKQWWKQAVKNGYDM